MGYIGRLLRSKEHWVRIQGPRIMLEKLCPELRKRETIAMRRIPIRKLV